MIHQVLKPLSLHFIVLEALRQKQDAFQGEYFLARITKVVATDLHLVLELRSVLGVERRLRVEQLEEDDADGPDVGLVGIVRLLHHLRGHVKWRATNSLVDLVESFQFFRETEIRDLNFEVCIQEVNFSKKLLLLLFVIVSKLFILREIKHDVLKLEVAVDHQHGHHVVEAGDEHAHDFLDYSRIHFELLQLHQVFHIAAIAEIHEHIISRISLDRLPKFDHKEGVDRVLVLDLAHNQLLLGIVKVVPLHDLAGHVLGTLAVQGTFGFRDVVPLRSC